MFKRHPTSEYQLLLGMSDVRKISISKSKQQCQINNEIKIINVRCYQLDNYISNNVDLCFLGTTSRINDLLEKLVCKFVYIRILELIYRKNMEKHICSMFFFVTSIYRC